MTKAKTNKNNEKDVLIVTQQGYDDMLKELDNRVTVLRAEIADEIKLARELGDLSENEPYAHAMQRKEMNDARIDELEYLISIAKVANSSDEADDVVVIGRTVELQKVSDGTKRTIVLVGKEETQQANPSEGKVSVDSPIGKAVNLARVGQTVTVKLPSGEVDYKILRFAA